MVEISCCIYKEANLEQSERSEYSYENHVTMSANILQILRCRSLLSIKVLP